MKTSSPNSFILPIRIRERRGSRVNGVVLSHHARRVETVWRTVFVVLFFGCVPLVGAVMPAPDGGYPNANTAEGELALWRLNTDSGTNNTAVGAAALRDLQTGSHNTAVGSGALVDNFVDDNTAVGFNALEFCQYGTFNTAVGSEALSENVGSQNTAIGAQALAGNFSGNVLSTGSLNTATGYQSLYFNKTGESNVANGWQALYSNTSGSYNTATGAIALNENTTGSYNTANGINALRYNTTGKYNTATGGNSIVFGNGQYNSAYGFESLQNNATGNNNTAIGVNALFNNNSGSSNVAVGFQAGQNLSTGSNNIIVGAGVLGSSADVSVTRIGKTTQKKVFVGGIYNIAEPVASGIKPVYVNSTGQLGTTPPASSARFKEAIKPMEKASEGILSLKPVTFRYKDDSERTPQFGLIAEEVAKANPDLVIRDENGEIYTVRYDAVNAMLLNEFLKEHRRAEEQARKVEEQDARVAKAERVIAQQQKQIEALTAGLQKVSAQVQLSKSAPQAVANTGR